MYDDNPSDRCFYGMLVAMYEKHSIRRNICGSCDSIKKITPELLYQCYSAFYQFSNMSLIICGDVDADAILNVIYAHLPTEATSIKVIPENENSLEKPNVFKPFVEQKMQVSKPIFNIGFKDTDISENSLERQKKDAAMSILDEMLFSRAGELYSSLYDRALISPAFSYGYTISESCAYNSLAGEADDPVLVLKEILKYLDNVAEIGLSKDDFERGKRVMYAEFVKSFDSTDNIANNLFTFICEDSELLSYADIIESITFDDVCKLFKTAFSEECTALSVIYPIK